MILRDINKKIAISSFVVIMLALVFSRVTYATFTVNQVSETDTITFGEIGMTVCPDDANGNPTCDVAGNIIGTYLRGDNTTGYIPFYPMADPNISSSNPFDGMNPYVFTIENTGDLTLKTTIYLTPDTSVESQVATFYTQSGSESWKGFVNNTQYQYFKVAIYEDGTLSSITSNNIKTLSSIVSNQNELLSVTLTGGQSKTYYMYMWLSNDALTSGSGSDATTGSSSSGVVGSNNIIGKYLVTQISAKGEYVPKDKITKITNVMAAASKGTLNSYAAIARGDTANSGVYQTNQTDDGSTVYFYRGNVQNNWVRFGNDGNGTCYYWRIIRTNTNAEGGGVRLLYAGSSTTCSGSVPVMTNAYINNTTYYYAISSGDYKNSSYSGYMYDVGSQHGHGTSSNAKTQIDLWYTSSGLSNFASSINENAIYCSDRTTATNLGTYGTWRATGTEFSYSAGYRAGYYYKSSGRLAMDTSVISPTLACTNSEDKFSKGTVAGGNGYLSNPIAMMTSDELIYAGAKYGSNSYAYYYYASDSSSSATGSTLWWTMSQFYWDGIYPRVFSVYGSSLPGYLDYYSVYSGGVGLRPVVSLSPNASISGSGTVSDPYVVYP